MYTPISPRLYPIFFHSTIVVLCLHQSPSECFPSFFCVDAGFTVCAVRDEVHGDHIKRLSVYGVNGCEYGQFAGGLSRLHHRQRDAPSFNALRRDWYMRNSAVSSLSWGVSSYSHTVIMSHDLYILIGLMPSTYK